MDFIIRQCCFITLALKLLLRIQSFYSGYKVIIPDSKLLLWIQSFYFWFKVIISDPKLLLQIQSYYSGYKVIIRIQSFSLDPKILFRIRFLLWIQGFYLRSKDPIQLNIPKLKFEHVTSSSPFNMTAAQGEELDEVTFPSFSI